MGTGRGSSDFCQKSESLGGLPGESPILGYCIFSTSFMNIFLGGPNYQYGSNKSLFSLISVLKFIELHGGKNENNKNKTCLGKKL
jgi:hypothetical protein